jgi:hypothetical protein
VRHIRESRLRHKNCQKFYFNFFMSQKFTPKFLFRFFMPQKIAIKILFTVPSCPKNSAEFLLNPFMPRKKWPKINKKGPPFFVPKNFQCAWPHYLLIKRGSRVQVRSGFNSITLNSGFVGARCLDTFLSYYFLSLAAFLKTEKPNFVEFLVSGNCGNDRVEILIMVRVLLRFEDFCRFFLDFCIFYVICKWFERW